MNRFCTIALAVLVLGTGGPLVAPEGSAAQAADKGKAKARKSGSNAKPTRARKPKPSRTTQPDPAGDPPPPEDSAPAPAAASASEPAGAGARGGKPRVYTFGGLDLEGKLKTPQLLYFRGRMRQELDASSLQRRSFLKELEKTADDQGL